VGEEVLMAGDIANGIDRFENSVYVTDDVTGIFMASDVFVTVACDFQALWVNAPDCKISRALCGVSAALPAASAAMRESLDLQQNRMDWTFAVIGTDWRLVNATEIAWWLRFVYRPRQVLLKSILTETDERRGEDIRVYKVQLSTDKKKFIVQASLTWDIWLSLLNETHAIPKNPNCKNIRVCFCNTDGSLLSPN
jgi:hypothetical protein